MSEINEDNGALFKPKSVLLKISTRTKQGSIKIIILKRDPTSGSWKISEIVGEKINIITEKERKKKKKKGKTTADKNNKNNSTMQEIVFGYACNQTKEKMPLPILMANSLSKRLFDLGTKNILPYLRPDGKIQIVVEYKGEDKKSKKIPKRIDSISIITQHDPIELNKLKNDLMAYAIFPVSGNWIDGNTKYYINKNGAYILGSLGGDIKKIGVSGRKLVMDTYGTWARTGSGALSGKDPLKVDRCGAYMARHIAKNIVSAGITDEIEIQVSYIEGKEEPNLIQINTNGTNKIPEKKILALIKKNFDLRPKKIVEYLNLQKPIYKQTARFGHFGNKNFPWEDTEISSKLKKQIKQSKGGVKLWKRKQIMERDYSDALVLGLCVLLHFF